MSHEPEIYTASVCLGNPGPWGWGALPLYAGKRERLCRGEELTTNNRMELSAAINAPMSFSRVYELTLYTGTQYVREGITEWIDNWKRGNWRTAPKKPMKNGDLWRMLDE